MQLVAVGFLVAGPAGEAILPGTILIGTVLLWISAILTIYTGWDYLRASLDHIVEDIPAVQEAVEPGSKGREDSA